MQPGDHAIAVGHYDSLGAVVDKFGVSQKRESLFLFLFQFLRLLDCYLQLCQ